MRNDSPKIGFPVLHVVRKRVNDIEFCDNQQREFILKVKKDQNSVTVEGIRNWRAFNVSGNVHSDIDISIRREKFFFKNIRHFYFYLNIPYYMKFINWNWMCYKIYPDSDFSWLQVINGTLPLFKDYTGSSMQPEVTLTL